MAPMQLVVSGLLTLIVYGMALFAVYRIFQIGNDVAEIKKMLQEMKRNALDAPVLVPSPLASPSPAATPQSAEALVRAVHESYKSVLND